MRDARVRNPLARGLWGIDPGEAEALLAEQEAPLQRERLALEQTVAALEAEERQLLQEIADLTRRLELAEERVQILRQSVAQQRSIQKTQGLALTRELARREQEHRGQLALLVRQGEALQREIAERRASLNAWVSELLASLAARSRL